MLAGFFTSYAQQKNKTQDELISKVVGEWKIVRYQSKGESSAFADTLIFKLDGTLQTDSVYFDTRKATFRTDETRRILIIETNTRTTEWSVSINNGVMRLRSAKGSKQPKIYITLAKVGKS